MADPVRRYYAALEARAWDEVESLLAPDFVYELPQSHERVHGRENYLRFNQDYPGEWHLEVDRIIADGDREAAVRLTVTYEGEPMENLSLLSFDDQQRITRMVDFWPEPSERPSGRPDYVERD